MSDTKEATGASGNANAHAFISYASADLRQAKAICDAIEDRGTECWLSNRDVPPGANYQEAIVQALRSACAMVLIFSKAANSSDEIKKELSLASRFKVPVIALKIDNAEPSDAFAYELSTRQWIEAAHSRDAALDTLVKGLSPKDRTEPSSAPSRIKRVSPRFPKQWGMVATVLLLVLAAAAWWRLGVTRGPIHSMTVRMAGYQSLSPDLPQGLHDTTGAEAIAAFNADGVIGVSTANTPEPGKGPAYALGGTIHRTGDTIRVITRLTNERSGVVLWSDSKDYPVSEVGRIPHLIAVDAATVVRCGLFGASTYRKPLPDAVLGDYLQYCQNYWAYGGTKTLIPAQRVVAALPDFSWGWSAVANGFMQASYLEPDKAHVAALRSSGLEAEDKAISIDPKNSEALAHKAYLIDPHAWAEQERLFKQAIASKPLDCGCEHFGYGLLLRSVGRLGDAVIQFKAATDMLALWPDSQAELAQSLVATGRLAEAAPALEAWADLSSDPNTAAWGSINSGMETGNFAEAIAALQKPGLNLEDETKAAMLSGYRALQSGNASAKAAAVQAIMALPADKKINALPTMLGALGANREALAAVGDDVWVLWQPSMRGALHDPGFAEVAKRLGLMAYWKSSKTRPDACGKPDAPDFCRLI